MAKRISVIRKDVTPGQLAGLIMTTGSEWAELASKRPRGQAFIPSAYLDAVRMEVRQAEHAERPAAAPAYA